MASRAEAHARELRREGFIILPRILERREIDAVKAELAPYLRGELMGRNDFEGLRSERVYALLAKAPSVARLVEHPRVLAVIDQLLFPHYRLSAALAINVHPGETAQGYHPDDAYCPAPRPREMFGVSAIWALDDFTETNGATEFIPGSHLWNDGELRPDDPRGIPAVMLAGSVLLLAGTTYHRGGANRSDGTRLGITPQYCQPWLRQIENMVLAVPPEIARRYSPRVQQLLGYDIMEPTFVGYVDGLHPRRLLDPGYVGEGHRPAEARQEVQLPGLPRGARPRRTPPRA